MHNLPDAAIVRIPQKKLFTNPALKGSRLLNTCVRQERLPMVREALTALALAVFVSGLLGVLVYRGADAFMNSFFVIAITREVLMLRG